MDGKKEKNGAVLVTLPHSLSLALYCSFRTYIPFRILSHVQFCVQKSAARYPAESTISLETSKIAFKTNEREAVLVLELRGSCGYLCGVGWCR